MIERTRWAAFRAVGLVVLGGTAAAAVDVFPHTYLADLPPEVEEQVRVGREENRVPDEPRQLLDFVFRAAPAYSFRAGPLSVQTDRRWFATVPPDEPGAPTLELRRWPGDTVLALYPLAGAAPRNDREPRMIPGAKLDPRPNPAAGPWRWEGTFEGPFGSRPALWIERRVSESGPRLGALLLPGDAGLGFQARYDLTEELEAVLDRVEVRSETWASVQGLPTTTPIRPPRLDSPYGEGSETADSWQVVEGMDYTLNLPPGVRARRLDIGLSAPGRQVPGGLLWLRGRFVDRQGDRVVIGDGSRTGYLAEIRPQEPARSAGKMTPLGAPGASLVTREPFHATDVKKSGASAMWAERWREPGFRGEWLVFRLEFEDHGLELGLPMVSGRQSLSLFWIPLSFRGPGKAAAAPPVDPAERFGISFERFTRLEQKKHPWSEGYLRVPGLRMEVPNNWWPSAMLRSKNGFPVRLVDGAGRTVGHLHLLPEGSIDLNPEKGGTWTPLARPSTYRAASAYRRGDGARLLVTQEGYGFLIEPMAGVDFDRYAWDQMADSILIVLPRP